jgi:aspartate racemase
MLRESAHALVEAGAALLICPDNTAHLGLAGIELPKPFLHIAEPLVAEARARGLRKLGLMGTARLTRSAVYRDPLASHGVDVLIPSDADIEALDACIFGELTRNEVSAQGRALARRIASSFERQGCEALILGCTELPLLFAGETLTVLPQLDTNLLLARAATLAACRGL